MFKNFYTGHYFESVGLFKTQFNKLHPLNYNSTFKTFKIIIHNEGFSDYNSGYKTKKSLGDNAACMTDWITILCVFM